MNTTNFEYMLTLEKTGTVTQTAEHFFVSPSAISQCLKNEEKQFGYPIFERKDKKMVPTPAGEIYLDGARHILEIRSRTMAEIRKLSEKKASIRIAVVPMFSHIVQSIIKPEFSRRFPDETFEWIPTDSRTGIAYADNHLSEFALVTVPASVSLNLQGITLGHDRLLPVVPMAYLRGKLNHVPTLSDCVSIPFILLKQGSYMRECQDQLLAKNHLILNRVYEVENSLTAKQFLEDGKGIPFLPESMISEELRAHCHILSPSPEISFFYRLVWSEKSRTPSKADFSSERYSKIADAIQKLWPNKV